MPSCSLPQGRMPCASFRRWRSEEHTSELQSRVLISYAVFCLKKKKDLADYKTKVARSPKMQEQMKKSAQDFASNNDHRHFFKGNRDHGYIPFSPAGRYRE